MVQTPAQQAYLQKLLGFQFSIDFKSGSTNTMVDSLSRVYDGLDLNTPSLESSVFSFLSQPNFDFFA